MFKKIVMVMVCFSLISCQGSELKKQEEEFVSSYKQIRDQFQADRGNIKSQEEYNTLLETLKKNLEDLLEKHQGVSPSDRIEVLKARVLIDLRKLDKADEIADRLIQKKSKSFLAEAKMVKVQIKLFRREVAEGMKIFREIEQDFARDDTFFNTVIAFALYSQDPDIKREYSKKVLGYTDLPEKFIRVRPVLYRNLASIERESHNLKEAAEMLRKAIEIDTNPQSKASMTSELEQLELIDKEMIPVTPETWINTGGLSAGKLKGKVVILDFWATWCAPCRSIIPTLNTLYETYRDKGLEIVGITRLYGQYNDGTIQKRDLKKTDEIKLLREFVQKNGMKYPLAVSPEGEDFDRYKVSVLPTMVFIDKKGKIKNIKIGSHHPDLLKEQIKKLLEEE